MLSNGDAIATKRKRNHAQVSKTLLLISVVFVLATTPYGILSAYLQFTPLEPCAEPNPVLSICWLVCQFLSLLNHSVNFFVYYSVVSSYGSFKDGCLAILKCQSHNVAEVLSARPTSVRNTSVRHSRRRDRLQRESDLIGLRESRGKGKSLIKDLSPACLAEF